MNISIITLKHRLRQALAGAAILVWTFQVAMPVRGQVPPSLPYTWRNVVIGGGGFVTGIIFHPRERNLVYARTDVGGAYRWDAIAERWIPLTDWAKDIDFTGIESVAVDPSDADRVYLAAGIYRNTRAAILSSTNRGDTWRVVEVPFNMGGNEPGRFNGERLAVDPNDGKILFFGSRRNGLWRSADRGASWQRVAGFPEVAEPGTSPWRQVGIVFVQFVATSGTLGNQTPEIYAGVSVTGTNLFHSSDGGRTWSPVLGAPSGLRPNHIAMSQNGMIYVSYGDLPGPSDMRDGAVWKFNPHQGAWTDITPLKSPDRNQFFGYGTVSVDPQNSETLMAATFCRWQPHDEIFRSTNGGKTWTMVLDHSEWDHVSAPYTKSRAPHWIGGIAIDPFDSNHVLFLSGYGIWSCNRLNADGRRERVRWQFDNAGLEETVPLTIISPPEGAHLLSGVGDIDGFRHDDLNRSPSNGDFSGSFFSTEEMAFAGKNPSVIVRAGHGNSGMVAALSKDGGITWRPLAVPDPAGGGKGIAVSADGGTIVLTLHKQSTMFTMDEGENWSPCQGLEPGSCVRADAVNPERFYAADPDGRLLSSMDGGKIFVAIKTLDPDNRMQVQVTPDREGDLWLILHDGGIFHSTNGGTSVVKLESVKAHAIGFGKSAAKWKLPMLFIAGTVGRVDGIFRSPDYGASWVRINDDRHQFGEINAITGDPRIEGRVYLATSGRGIIYGDEADLSASSSP